MENKSLLGLLKNSPLKEPHNVYRVDGEEVIDYPAWREQFREVIMELLPKGFFADAGNQLYVDGYTDCYNETVKAINQF